MSSPSTATVGLDGSFARDLPELAVAWQAETPPDPRLLVLNEPLAAELGLDPARHGVRRQHRRAPNSCWR